MKKIISVTAVLLMLSFVMVDSRAAFAGGGPAAPAPTRRTVPTPKETTPATPTAPATPSAPAAVPASAPAATVPMAYPGGYSNAGYPYSNIGSCNYGNCGAYGSFSAGCSQSQSCNRGTTVVVDCGSSNHGKCAGNFRCCEGRGLVIRLLNHGNIAGARAVLRNMNRSLYFGGCAGAC